MNMKTWKNGLLRDAGQWVGGLTPSMANNQFWDNGTVPWASPKDFRGPVISRTKCMLTTTALDGTSLKYIPKDSVLVVFRSGILRNRFPVATAGVPLTINQDIKACLTSKKVNPYFLADYLRLNESNILRDCAKVGTTVESIDLEAFLNFPMPLPEKSVQNCVMELLSTWDRAIEQTERLIAAKRRRKQGLMQQLLTGKRRFRAFGKPHSNSGESNDWPYVKVKALFEIRSTKGNPNLPVLSVTQDQGVVLRSSLERKINMSDTNTGGYKLVEPGDFVISLRSFQGGLEYSTIRGIVSPAYYVISPKGPICSSFYKHFFKSKWFVKHLAAVIIGIRDGKQVNYGDFASMRIPYPSLGQQQKIADCLDSCDRELETLCRKRDVLKEQKKGLMQQLLTGKVRVRL